MPTEEDSFHHIVGCLRGEIEMPYGTHEYDLYLPNAIPALPWPGNLEDFVARANQARL